MLPCRLCYSSPCRAIASRIAFASAASSRSHGLSPYEAQKLVQSPNPLFRILRSLLVRGGSARMPSKSA